jgi:hypothetical protein
MDPHSERRSRGIQRPAHAKKYLGQDRDPYRKPGEVRVIFTIVPDRVQAMG